MTNNKINNQRLKILDIGSGPWKYPGSISIDWNERTNTDIIWDLNKLPWPLNDNEFDIVYASHILEHLDEPVKIVEEVYRILKSKGKFIVKVPHFSSRMAYNLPEHKHFFLVIGLIILQNLILILLQIIKQNFRY